MGCCRVYCLSLVWHANRKEVVQLPRAFIRERYLIPREKRSVFVQTASPFEDFVVRCIRYAFAHIPPRIGRVFFSKEVALPFLWFRCLRHGHLGSPIHWEEHREVILPQSRIWNFMLTVWLGWFSWCLADQESQRETGFCSLLRTW